MVKKKPNGKTLLHPQLWWEIWVHDFGQFHFMIQGSNKFLKKKEEKITKMPRSLFYLSATREQ